LYGYNWVYSFGISQLPRRGRKWKRIRPGSGRNVAFRSIRNRNNDWLIDRKAQKTETFTGIEGVNNQDLAVQESMGPIVDRTKEHLSVTDRAVVAARRLLLQAAKTVADGGDPPGLGETYYRARAIERTLPTETPWRDALLREMYPE
jgi:hypothetical protein